MPRTDLELLDAWRSGDRTAGSELFDRHFDSLARFFVNKVDDGLDDLVQQTFLACVESAHRFRGDAKFRTFLLGIAHNVLCKHYRRRRTRGEAVDFTVTSVADLGPSASLLLARQGEQRLLARALRHIPLDAQVVLELVFWEKLTAAEVGEVLDIPLGTAKTRIRRAKRLLTEAVTVLSESPETAQSTLGDLDGWAASMAALARAR